MDDASEWFFHPANPANPFSPLSPYNPWHQAFRSQDYTGLRLVILAVLAFFFLRGIFLRVTRVPPKPKDHGPVVPKKIDAHFELEQDLWIVVTSHHDKAQRVICRSLGGLCSTAP